MRAIMVMFDTLNRRYLPAYGSSGVVAPNFERLREHAATFDNCYGGSMPCMPARRELHTGRHNFLHRSWGPLEPFDDSVPEMLGQAGVYTHLVTDHQHYWEDGGATYHTRFSSHEFFRGQEGDRWKGHVADPPLPESVSLRTGNAWRQDLINRSYYPTETQHPQTLTVDAGLEFIATNAESDRWFLQIECFDPHEPFVSYPEHRSHYLHDYAGVQFDWPDYRRVLEDGATVTHLRDEYSALLTMCDASLGRVLDAMDAGDLWRDTMLIVCTDHGLLLGEHGWWGKNVQPWYDENIHTPLFIWDPRTGVQNERREALVQTIDFGPTLLEFFGVAATPDMTGSSLAGTVADDRTVREAGLFGSFGAHVNVTDGRYVYMRAPGGDANEPLEEFTLMPTHMASRYSPAELKDATLSKPLSFTKDVPVLRLTGRSWGNPAVFGTLLFDLATDPGQQSPLLDDEQELRMIELMLTQMRASGAPLSQYERLGLPAVGPCDRTHLRARNQVSAAAASTEPLPGEDELARAGGAALLPLSKILADDALRAVLVARFPLLASEDFSKGMAHLSLLELASLMPALNAALLRDVSAELNAVGARGRP